MPIQIVPHSAAFGAAVADFNRRMAAGGSRWTFYTDPLPDWIPPRPGQRVRREYHLAVEDGAVVRGAFALKPQDWWVRGETVVVTDWQGPFSEGAIDPPTQHMRWTGTISIPEGAFEGLLEGAARSLLQHGFRDIFPAKVEQVE